MANPSIEDLKNEIADCYIKNFRKELGWLKGATILPIKSSMKDILTGKKDLPEKFVEIEDFKFWKNIIQFVSPKLANQIFDFLKTKRQEIISRRTKSELEDLKNEILGIEKEDNNSEDDDSGSNSTNGGGGTTRRSDNNGSNSDKKEGINPVAGGVATSAGGTFAVYKMQKWAENREVRKISKNLDDFNLKLTIDGAIDAMEKQKNVLESRLTPHQLKTVEKHIARLREGVNSVDGDSAKLLKDWMSLGDKLPKKLLKDWGIDPKNLNMIDDIADELVGKEVDDIKGILENKGIRDIDDSILECFSLAKDGKEVKTMTRVLRGGSKFKKIVDTFAGAMWLDVAFLGLDVRMYIESDREADAIEKINKARGENKHNQAMFQLITGLSSVIAEGLVIIASCASTGAYGGRIGLLVGVAVGLATWGVSEAGDALYYDVKDFYLQNSVDFLSQTRGELKQAILQGVHNCKKGDTSMNEMFTTFVDPDLCPGCDAKMQSLKDACRSMIFLEELENGNSESGLKNNEYLLDFVRSGQIKRDYLKDKDANFKKYFNEYWEKMQKRIDVRMEYVQKELEKDDVINHIYGGSGTQYLTKIFTESMGYANLKEQSKWDESKNYDANMQEYKKELFKDFPPEKVAKLESIKLSNPSLFLDIMTMTSTDFIDEDDEENPEMRNYVENVKLVEKYREYLSMVENLEDKEYLYVVDNMYRNGGFISNLLEVDFDLDKVKYETIKDEETVADIVGVGNERWGLTEISDDILQNILYRVAKQLNGYAGKNDLYSLMEFYSENKGNVYGVYFSDKWRVNNDWGRDYNSVTKDIILEIIYESDVNKYVDKFMKSFKKSEVDTSTESIDEELTKEVKNEFKKIATDELKNHTEENKIRVKKMICDVVKKNSGGKYMELPYYLILEAKKAGLGDLQRQVFKWNNDAEEYIPGLPLDDWSHIDVCYLDDYNVTSIDDRCGKLYVTKLRETYTDEEKYYIDRVDNARKKLAALMSVQGGGISQNRRQQEDLDLPTDIQGIISEKARDWDKFKELVLMYNPTVSCSQKVISQYEEYATYFENLYRGILLAEIGYSASNDIDSFDYFQQAMGCGYTDLFDDEGKIKAKLPDHSDGFKFLKDPKFQEFYNSLLQEEVKLGDGPKETLEYLRKNGTDEQKQVAKQASYFIVTTTLEKGLLAMDGDEVLRINYGEPSLDEGQKTYIKTALQQYLSKKILPPIISEEKIKELVGNRKREVKKMNIGERWTTDLTPLVEDAIRDNKAEEFRWGYKRLQLRYDIEEKKVESWGKKTAVSFQGEGNNVSMSIVGLDIKFNNIKEGIRVANLINWLKVNMEENEVGRTVPRLVEGKLLEYMRDGGSLVRDVEGSANDVEVLTEDIVDKWYSTIKGNSEFLEFINKLLKSISRDNSRYNDWGDLPIPMPTPEFEETEQPEQP